MQRKNRAQLPTSGGHHGPDLVHAAALLLLLLGQRVGLLGVGAAEEAQVHAQPLWVEPGGGG